MIDIDTLEQIIADFEGNVHSTEFAKELIKHIERSLPSDFKYGKDYERIGWEASINDLIAWLNNYPENYINPNEVIWEINKRFNRSTTTKPELSEVERVARAFISEIKRQKLAEDKDVAQTKYRLLVGVSEGICDAHLVAKAAIAAMRPAVVDDGKLVNIIINAQKPTWGKVVYTCDVAQNILNALRPYLRDTKPVSSPPALVKAVIESIDKLGAMKMDEIHAQNDVGFMELLDMAITLRNQVRPLSGWQPIETAPKDDSDILCLNSNTGEVRVATRKLFAERSDGSMRYEWFRSNEYCPGHTWSINATHWMPLPSSPKQETV